MRGPRRLLRARARRREAAASTRSARTSGTCSGRGIVPPERVDAVVDQLMGDGLWSGWGVRTMSRGRRRRTARSRTTTEPSGPTTIRSSRGASRSTSAGPRRTGSCSACSTASRHFDYQLPEVFAGLPRSETPFPIAYPTAARPQAWAAGTPVLLLQVLLGLQPDRRRHRLESVAPPELPSLGGHDPPLRRPRVRAAPGMCDSRTAACSRGGRHENRRPRAVLVPRAADRLRRHRVGRLAARGRARRRRPRRDALRVGRLAHEGEARGRSSRSRRASGSAARSGSSATSSTATSAPATST